MEIDNQMKGMSAKLKNAQEERQRMINWIKQRNEEISGLQLDKRFLINSNDGLKGVMLQVLNKASSRQYSDIIEIITPNRRDQSSANQANTTQANQMPILTHRLQMSRNNYQSQENARVHDDQPVRDDCATSGQ
jgi:hypothetical protein